MLACLTQDWMAGTLLTNWWWRSLLKTGVPDFDVTQEWDRSPELLPAAVAILQRQAHAVEFVRRLPETRTSRLLEAMLRAHGIVQTSAVAPSLEAKRWPDTPLPPVADPWLPWVPEALSAANLTPSARLMLAYALLLRRAPDVARGSWFASRVAEWRAGATSPTQAQDRPRSQAEVEKRRVSPASPTETDVRPKTDPGALPAWTDETRLRQRAFLRQDLLEIPESQHPDPPQGHTPSSLATPAHQFEDLPTVENTVPPITGSTLGPPVLIAVDAPAVLEKWIAEEEWIAELEIPTPVVNVETTVVESPPNELTWEEVESAFGGAFFLLNLALCLSLYGDFANPLLPGLHLNIWDFVALSLKELTGDDCSEDAIWPLLAKLAGHSTAEKPGASFSAPDVWRMPVEWLDAFPEEQPWRVNAGDGRFRVTHPAGFCVVDVPLSDRTTAEAIAEELPPYSALDLTLGNAELEKRGSAMPSPLSRWTAWMTGYLRVRLMRALGCEEAALLLCRIPARVRITPGHLQVSIRLNEHPIEIRLAGLDRDPGWIPASGRYVTFHFD